MSFDRQYVTFDIQYITFDRQYVTLDRQYATFDRQYARQLMPYQFTFIQTVTRAHAGNNIKCILWPVRSTT